VSLRRSRDHWGPEGLLDLRRAGDCGLGDVSMAYSSRAPRDLLRHRGIGHTIAEPDDQRANRRRRGSAGGHPVGSDPAR
jgi:hypothetical protein